MMQKIALLLIGLGLLAPLSYVFYLFFTFPLIPIYFRLAPGAIVLGVILLLVSVGWDRFKAAKKENFKEVEK